MSDRPEWPAWARQHEAPIAVAGEYERLRQPDDGSFDFAFYADGMVLSAPGLRAVDCQTPEQVRQIRAALQFPGDDSEMFEWWISLSRANARRDRLLSGLSDEHMPDEQLPLL